MKLSESSLDPFLTNTVLFFNKNVDHNGEFVPPTLKSIFNIHYNK